MTIMFKKNLLVQASIAISTAVSFSPAVVAQQQVNFVLEEVIVTARKREESLQSTPVAVTAISAADIKAAGLQSVADIDKSAPNMWFQEGGGGGSTSNNAQLYIRGVGQFDFIPTADPGVGTYIDGVYLGRSVGGIFNLNDVAQIEVLRGPQGTLFGRNTIGGAINVTTTRPDFEENGGYLEVTAGSDKLLESDGVGNYAFSETMAARLSFNVKNRDGYGKSITEPDIDFGNVDKTSVRGSFRWAVSDNLELNFAADYMHQDQNSTPSNVSEFTGGGLAALQSGLVLSGILPGVPTFIPSPTGGAPVAITPNVAFHEESKMSSKNGPGQDDGDIWGLGLTLDWDAFDWGSIKSVTSYREMDLHFADDNDGYFIDVAVTDEQFDQRQFSQEFQLTGEVGNFNWVSGLYYFKENVKSNNTVTILPGLVQALEALPGALLPLGPGAACPLGCAGGAGNPLNFALDNNQITFNDIDVENTAVFAQGTYDLNEYWSVTAGFRFTEESKDLDRSQLMLDSSVVLGVPFYTVPLQTFSDSWTEFSPKLGLEYKPHDDLLVYGSFSEGFRSGTFNGRGGAPDAISDSVDPETVSTYELGVKSEFYESRVRLNAAIYFNDYEDLQVQTVQATPSGGFSIFLLNAATAEIYGGEAELTVLPHPQWTVSASAGYTHATITSIDAEASFVSGISDGDVLRKTPEMTASIATNFNQSTQYGDIDFRISWSWRDEIYHSANNDPLSKEDAVGQLDARFAFTTNDGKWEASIFGTNLTDEFIYNNIFIPGGSSRVNYWTRGREYGASVRYNF